MKATTKMIAAMLILVMGAVCAQAEIVGDMNWADSVTDWTEKVQCYGVYESPEMLSASTTWWLTGAPDADVNGNGYAWDTGTDQDSVAGWRSFGDCSFTVYFNTALNDLVGDDLKIVTYGGPNGQSTVSASADGVDYVSLGTIEAGVPGCLDDLWFDFDGLIDNVQYIKIDRDIDGPQTGRFIDAIGGVAGVPEPSTLIMLMFGTLALAGLRIRSQITRQKAAS